MAYSVGLCNRRERRYFSLFSYLHNFSYTKFIYGENNMTGEVQEIQDIMDETNKSLKMLNEIIRIVSDNIGDHTEIGRLVCNRIEEGCNEH